MKHASLSGLIAALFLVGALAVLPASEAQSSDLSQSDASGDVTVSPGLSNPPQPPTGPGAVPVTGADQITGPYDLTGLRVFGETATDISFQLSVADFLRANTMAPVELVYTVCFDWSATGASYRFLFPFTFPVRPPSDVMTRPEFSSNGASFTRMPGACNGVDGSAYDPNKQAVTFTVDVDYNENTVTWTVPRRYFSELVNEGQPQVAPPSEGDKLSNLMVYAYGKNGAAFVFWDQLDSPAEYTFISLTGNDMLVVTVPNKVTGAFGISSFSIPTYSVEKGSFQVVPVTISNYLDHVMAPNITVDIVNGDAAKWSVRTLAGTSVGPKVGDTPGEETISLIVNADPSVKHKDKVTLLIRALDPSMSQHLGAALVDIVAVEPLHENGPTTIYFHALRDGCYVPKWFNTLAVDSIGPSAELSFVNCGTDAGLGRTTTTGDIGQIFRPDVPMGRNYVLSTQSNAKAEIVLKSVVRATASGTSNDVPLDMVADIKVELLDGLESIGEGIKTGQTIPGTDTRFLIEVPIDGRILGGFGREVLDETGLGVRVSVITKDTTIQYCNEQLCGFESELDVPSPTGKVVMSLTNSKMEIPVVSSEKAGAILNITASGALLTLRQSDTEAPSRVAVNPGKSVVFNVTVRNEGVNKDTAIISATLNKQGWDAEILPSTSYTLKVGQPRFFNVRVTAPEGAREGDTLRLTVIATSKVDSEASAKLPLDVMVTTGLVIDNGKVDPKFGEVKEKKDSPDLSVAALLAVLALGAVAVRRRR